MKAIGINIMKDAHIDIELTEIGDFLRMNTPFDRLNDEQLRQIVHSIEITYAPSQTVMLPLDGTVTHLTLIRSGAADITQNDTLLTRLEEGDLFGYPALLVNKPSIRTVTAIEDTLLYRIPADTFHAIRHENSTFEDWFHGALSERVAHSAEKQPAPTTLTIPLTTMIGRPPITITPTATVRQAAQRMKQEKVSSLVVVEDEQVVGIFTDRDLRNRVVADEAVGLDAVIAAVMTPNPTTIDQNDYAFHAILTMSRHNIHHLPVMGGVDGDTLVGMVTSTDLMRLQASNPVYLIGDIWKQSDVDGLMRISQRVPHLVQRLMAADAKAADVGRVVSMVTDALTQRLLQLAEAQLGAPPTAYAWLAFGSQARQEQTAHSDQDNGLLLSDDVRPEDDTYFAQLATFVCDGLNACGYIYCPGDIMATNEQWRQPLQQWRVHFTDWINHPDPAALMNASTFFDMRHIHGDETLSNQLQAHIFETCANHSRFFTNLAQNAQSFQPPLGFFRRFVLEKGGDQNDKLDMKHRGVVPITDLARTYALAYGVPAVNTYERILNLIPTEAFVEADGHNLRDALEFIAYTRLVNQYRQLAAGQSPDNYLDPEKLSKFDRQHLKTAFDIVRKMQSTMAQRF